MESERGLAGAGHKDRKSFDRLLTPRPRRTRSSPGKASTNEDDALKNLKTSTEQMAACLSRAAQTARGS